MRTPENAKTVESLQNATGAEKKKEFLVLTENGLKKIQLEQFFNMKQLFIYNNIGKISQWSCSLEYLPFTEVLLLGGLLKASDFEDDLRELKKRCPSWVQTDGSIQLPNYNGYFCRMNVKNAIGNQENDSISTTSFKKRKLELEGLMTYTGERKTDESSFKKTETDTSDVSIQIPTNKNQNSKDFLSFSRSTWNYFNEGYFNFSMKSGFKVDLTPQIEGTSENETRPKNINALWSVCVGVPKTRKNPKEFTIKNSNQKMQLYEGASGSYIGYSQDIFEES